MEDKRWFSYLIEYAKYCKGKVLLSVILSIISVMSSIVPYIGVYKILKAFINNTANLNTIIYWSIIGIIFYLIQVICFGLSTGLSHISAYTILEKLRIKVINKFLNAPLGIVMGQSIGKIKNMIVDRIEGVEAPLAHLIPEVTGNILYPITIFIILFTVDFRIAFSSLITIPLTMIPFSILLKQTEKKYEKYIESSNHVSSVIVEYIEGIKVIKTFGQIDKSYKKFSNAISDYKKFIIDWMSSTWITMKLCFVLFPSTLLGTLPVGLFLYTRNILTPAELFFCLMLSMSMIGSLAKIEVFMNEIKQMAFIVNDVQSFLDMPELPSKTKDVFLSRYDITISKVHFSYTNDIEKEVLHGIDINIPEGSFTALVGPSGSGKSTIAKLIARFWDVTEGEIKIGGINIKNIPILQLSDIVSFVTQDNFLFNCSLLENIRLGNPKATDEEVYAAAKAAQCDEFISKFDKGYNTPAGEAGNRLSGGEKQRIAIARMILKNAPIVILDEATAFTDPENEHKIQQSISALTKGKTLLVIAHRLSTIKNADKIIVLNKGKVVAQGKQEELIENCSLYKNLWMAHIGSKAWSISKSKEVSGIV